MPGISLTLGLVILIDPDEIMSAVRRSTGTWKQQMGTSTPVPEELGRKKDQQHGVVATQQYGMSYQHCHVGLADMPASLRARSLHDPPKCRVDKIGEKGSSGKQSILVR